MSDVPSLSVLLFHLISDTVASEKENRNRKSEVCSIWGSAMTQLHHSIFLDFSFISVRELLWTECLCPPPKIILEDLTLRAVVFGGGAFGK